MTDPRNLHRTSLATIGFSTPDIARFERFYGETLGLSRIASTDGGILLGWREGETVLEVREAAAGLDYFSLGVGDDFGHTGAGERIADAGHRVEEIDGGALSVRDPDGNEVRLHPEVARAGEFVADTGRRPTRLQHITLGTASMQPMVDFYTALGFTVSDRMGDHFTWMRSHVEHHSVAVVNTGKAAMDHFSFDLEGWADFKTWCDRLTDIGVDVTWGPGRHGPGNNLFIFFDDPDGRHIELSAEMEKFYDDRVTYQPRIWEQRPQTVNLWGGQLPNWRDTGEGS